MYKCACFVNAMAVKARFAISVDRRPYWRMSTPLSVVQFLVSPSLSQSPSLCLTHIHTLTHISFSLLLFLSEDNRAGWTEMAFWMTQVGTSFSVCITGCYDEWYSLCKPLLMFWHNSTFININDTKLLVL